MRTFKITCPTAGFDCPYFKCEECGIEDPANDCDDFAAYACEDDYVFDEPRTLYLDD